MEPVRLTQFSHGSGCGCKIAPAVLEDILGRIGAQGEFPGLLVGNAHRDDAAVFDLGDGTAIISTTDFFTPIVDSPRDFGRIAAANALSDVYAMGGKPMMAIAILGWPVGKLPPEVAAQVVDGGREVCNEAGIPLAGGHSVDSPEPLFGLAVTGRVALANLKTNAGARPGDLLYLTKPLGVGIVSTAVKRGVASPAHAAEATALMARLNREGDLFGSLPYVHAMTDVTGFGLLGHLLEMCEAAGLSAEIDYAKVPRLPDDRLGPYLAQYTIPDNTYRNYNAYAAKVSDLDADRLHVLCDPQTNGGLLVAVDPGYEADFNTKARNCGLLLAPWGSISHRQEPIVAVL